MIIEKHLVTAKVCIDFYFLNVKMNLLNHYIFTYSGAINMDKNQKENFNKITNEEFELFFIDKYFPVEMEFYLNSEKLEAPDSFNCFNVRLKPKTYDTGKKSYTEFQEIDVILTKTGTQLVIATINVFNLIKEKQIEYLSHEISQLKGNKSDSRKDKILQRQLKEIGEQTGFKYSALAEAFDFRKSLNEKLTRKEYNLNDTHLFTKVENELPFFIKHKTGAEAFVSNVIAYEHRTHMESIFVELTPLWREALLYSKNFKLVINLDLFLKILTDTIEEYYFDFFR